MGYLLSYKRNAKFIFKISLLNNYKKFDINPKRNYTTNISSISNTHLKLVADRSILMLIEPVALADFFLSFFSAAMIILLATVYAGLFAWAKIRKHRPMLYGAWLAYLLLVVCVGFFSFINHFNSYWLVLSLLMVLGYGWMPHLIWGLCVATHADDPDHTNHSGGIS